MRRALDAGPEGVRSAVDLYLEVAPGAVGVGRSLEAALREAVRSGQLPAGTRLPGTRSLAADLGVARGTVVQAYTQLVAEGWLVGTTGSGTRVAEVAGDAAAGLGAVAEAGPPPRPARAQEPRAHDLRPGRPDLSSFPRSRWAASARRAVTGMAADGLDYGEPAGVPALRAALADYVARTRGVRASPESVVVTAGFTQGLALLGRALHRLGVRCAATEDPGFGRYRDLLRAAGLRTVPLPVGDAGADPDGLTGDAGLALLTPSHQHPSGVVLAPAHRTAFVAWARRGGGYVVEDDYDGEFRYDQQPVGAMQALAPDRVVYAGTASKSLAPGMRIGWLVVPPELRGPLLEAIEETGTAVPVIDQLALADLLERGDYDRHVRRCRTAYRRRRTELAERLAGVTSTPLAGVAAGLHALLPVDGAARERQLIAAGRRAGLHMHGLHTDGYWHAPDHGRQAALILGYAAPPPHAWRRTLDVLADVIASVAGNVSSVPFLRRV